MVLFIVISLLPLVFLVMILWEACGRHARRVKTGSCEAVDRDTSTTLHMTAMKQL
jgi:hypothetical protein